jgi:predicted dithiol-disulfide oxidoreductase (DUF899 family)
VGLVIVGPPGLMTRRSGNWWPPRKPTMEELPGISVFYKDDDGSIFHTYSCYARGLDMMNAASHWLDLVPKGRNESGPHKMAWVRLHDEYER